MSPSESSPLHQVLKKAIELLHAGGSSNAPYEAQLLLCHLLGWSNRLELHLQKNLPLSPSQISSYDALLAKIIEGQPLQHILETVPFHNLPLIYVSGDVLIPRPETEELVEYLLKKIKLRPYQNSWDICTGSGCIALALANALPNMQITGSDLSPKALAMAQRSHAHYSFSNLSWIQGDLLTPFAGKKADLIISNPPYIPTDDIQKLDPCVQGHEPHLALDGGTDGLVFYRRFAQEIGTFLNIGGILAVECGWNQGEALNQLFKNAIPGTSPELWLDSSGKTRGLLLDTYPKNS